MRFVRPAGAARPRAAAGSGRRMGSQRNKLLLPVAGRAVLAWTLDAVLACEAIQWIGVVEVRIRRLHLSDLIDVARCRIKNPCETSGGLF